MNNKYWFTEIAENIFDFISFFINKIFTKKEAEPTPIQMPVTPTPQPAPQPEPAPVPLTPRERFFATALSCVGIDASPNDVAPDELGCMETVDDIYFKAFGRYINQTKKQVTVSTIVGLQAMITQKENFKLATDFKPGLILISTVDATHPRKTIVGHVGICGANNIIYSNNSLTGKFDAHYTLDSWKQRYVTIGGFLIYMFEPI